MHIAPMYEYYVTPLQSNGIAKLNIEFRETELSANPITLHDIATVTERFDLQLFSQLEAEKRKLFVLERMHAAALRSANYFSWPMEKLQSVYERIVDDRFKFVFFYGTPKSSPNKSYKVQAWCDFSNKIQVYLIFNNK
ncbi:MAG: hypothetical protein ACMUJM_20620 [bacterium]